MIESRRIGFCRLRVLALNDVGVVVSAGARNAAGLGSIPVTTKNFSLSLSGKMIKTEPEVMVGSFFFFLVE